MQQLKQRQAAMALEMEVEETCLHGGMSVKRGHLGMLGWSRIAITLYIFGMDMSKDDLAKKDSSSKDDKHQR